MRGRWVSRWASRSPTKAPASTSEKATGGCAFHVVDEPFPAANVTMRPWIIRTSGQIECFVGIAALSSRSATTSARIVGRQRHDLAARIGRVARGVEIGKQWPHPTGESLRGLAKQPAEDRPRNESQRSASRPVHRIRGDGDFAAMSSCHAVEMVAKMYSSSSHPTLPSGCAVFGLRVRGRQRPNARSLQSPCSSRGDVGRPCTAFQVAI